jgi:hypothetical protein
MYPGQVTVLVLDTFTTLCYMNKVYRAFICDLQMYTAVLSRVLYNALQISRKRIYVFFISSIGCGVGITQTTSLLSCPTLKILTCTF